MAMAVEPFGIVPFVGVKFLGYSAAGLLIQHRYRTYPEQGEPSAEDAAPSSPWVFGAIRTLLGIAAGLIYAQAWEMTGVAPDLPEWWLFLVPVRLLEWSLVVSWFFDRRLLNRPRVFRYATAGALWSYALDVPAVMAVWVVPGAAWVC